MLHSTSLLMAIPMNGIARTARTKALTRTG